MECYGTPACRIAAAAGGWSEKCCSVGGNDYFCRRKNKNKMRNMDFKEQELEVLDYAPSTPEEAHLRISEAEQGIANGEVVLHTDVMRHSYELLEKYAC